MPYFEWTLVMLTVTKTERPVGSAFMTVFAAFRAVSRKFSTPRSVFQMDTTGPWRTNPSALGTTYDVPWAGSLYVLRLHYFVTICHQTAARPVASFCQACHPSVKIVWDPRQITSFTGGPATPPKI